MQKRHCFHAASTFLAGGLLLSASSTRADVELGVMVGGKFYSTDASLSRAGVDDQPQSALSHGGIFGLRLGYLPKPRFAIEAELGVSPSSMRGNLLFPNGVEIPGAQVAVVPLRAHLLLNILTGRFRPFVVVGGGGHLSSPLSPGIVRNDAKGALHAGAGLAFDIRPGWGLRFDGRFLLSEGVGTPLTPEGEVLAAVFGRFGSTPPPPAVAPPPVTPPPADAPPPVAPLPVTPPPAVQQTPAAPPPLIDSDGDGVLDAVDRCPTQAGPASSLGCPAATTAPPVQPASQVPIAPSPAAQALGLAARGIAFELNSAVLAQRSLPVLDQAVRVLSENPALQIEISGHTDTSGDPQQNRQISQQRAEAVMKYLVDHGVAASRLRAQGYASDKPIASNDTPEGRAKNRRVELTLIPPK